MPIARFPCHRVVRVPHHLSWRNTRFPSEYLEARFPCPCCGARVPRPPSARVPCTEKRLRTSYKPPSPARIPGESLSARFPSERSLACIPSSPLARIPGPPFSTHAGSVSSPSSLSLQRSGPESPAGPQDSDSTSESEVKSPLSPLGVGPWTDELLTRAAVLRWCCTPFHPVHHLCMSSFRF